MKSYYQNSLRTLAWTLVAILLTAGLSISHASNKSANSAAQKARHFFLQGALREATDNMDAAYEYYKKAYSIDSTYLPAAYSYGMMRISAPLDSFGSNIEKKRSLAIARKFVDVYPGDFFAASNYAYFSGILDTVTETIRVFEILDSIHPGKTTSLLHLGDAYASTRNYNKALSALNKYERIEGMSPALTLHKVSYHLADNDTAGAMAEIDRLISTNPENIELVALKGNVFSYINMPDSALFYLLKAEKADPSSGPVKESLVKFYQHQGDSLNYTRKVYEALLNEEIDIENKIDLTAIYLQKTINDNANTAKADSLFEVLRMQYPHDPRILALSARYNGAKGNNDKAIEDISYAIDLDNQNADLWTTLMLFQLRDDRNKDLMTTYKRAASTLEDVPQMLRILYASAAQQEGLTDEALATYDLLIKGVRHELSVSDSISDLSPFANLSIDDFSQLSNYFQMAADAAYSAQPKRLRDCFRMYENALAFNPSNILALNNYAYFIIEEENPDPHSPRFAKAKKMSKEAIDGDSENPTYLDTYAWILFKEGNYQEAKDLLNIAIIIAAKNDELSADLFSHMGDILFKLGDSDLAIENWEKALNLEPDNALLKKKISSKSYFEQ